MESNVAFHIEHRKKPVNITENEEALFQHEYEYKCYEPTLKDYKNIFFNTEGYVYQSFRPSIEELSANNTFANKSITGRIRNIIKCYFLKRGVIKEPCFFIHDAWSEGYFHWNLDALPRLYAFLQLAKFKIPKLILPKEYLKFRHITESLSLLGFNKENCMYVDGSSVYYTKEIATCPPFTHTGNYHSEIVRHLAEQLKKQVEVSVLSPSRLIYVSRRNAARRRVVNEEEIIGLLQQRGFEIVETDDMSYEEQIHLFNSAKWLVSIHGAALSNMMFMNKGCHVLELRNAGDRHNNCYFSLASTMELHYYYLENSADSDDTHVANLLVDPRKLEQLMDTFLK